MATVAPHGPLPKLEKTDKLQLGALVFDGSDLLDIMGPMRIFGEDLNTLDLEINFITVYETLRPIRTSQKVEITPRYTLKDAPPMDIWFMPGGIGTRGLSRDPEMMKLITPRLEHATWVMTVCTGASMLAKSGLIDGYNATTNKAVFEWAACEGPHVNWIKRARWVQDGKFVTSSGVSAGIDAALYIVSVLKGTDVAEQVSREIEYSWHRNADEDPFADMYEYTRQA
ncbi:DJ-1/PfpI family protein [Mortierella sp. GBAus27b]|nr:hypothetical protein BGX31_003988 [Mortierella sp. GBA43]KAI8349023.1 DJ-1/PfpI family protein [Mortierella sp. GBAus27b]